MTEKHPTPWRRIDGKWTSIVDADGEPFAHFDQTVDIGTVNAHEYLVSYVQDQFPVPSNDEERRTAVLALARGEVKP